jgi:hypothetical protein
MTEEWNDLSSKEKKKCELCYTYLRVFQNTDWTNRKYHKKCFLNKKKRRCVICEKSLKYEHPNYPHCYDCSTEILLRKGYVYCQNEFCDHVISPKTKKRWDYCKDCQEEIEEECLISD